MCMNRDPILHLKSENITAAYTRILSRHTDHRTLQTKQMVVS